MLHLKASLESEAITLEADAQRIAGELATADLDEHALVRLRLAIVQPRLAAAKALREAKLALERIPSMGVGRY